MCATTLRPLFFSADRFVRGCLKTSQKSSGRGEGKNKKIGGTKFKLGQLILWKIFKIVATRCHILRLKCTKFDSAGALPQTPLGSSQRSPEPLAGFKGSTSKGMGRSGKGKRKGEGREGRGKEECGGR